ncbi:MAG: MASE1 domain-containing protein [Caulobacter sp.]|nr:MASE1 domain-containing protein [Caulobacter sp.]
MTSLLDGLERANLTPRTLREWLLVASLALIYCVGAVVSLRWAVVPGAGTAFWPSAGIALAAIAYYGPRVWLGALLGRLLTFWVMAAPQPLWSQLVIATATALGALVPVLILNRLKTNAKLDSLPSALWLVIGAGAGGATISAGAGALMLLLSGSPVGKVDQAFVNWWFGFLTGVLTFAPVFMTWRGALERWTPTRIGHLTLICVATGALAYLIFLRGEGAYSRAWFVFPLLVWAGLAFDTRGAALASLLVSLCAFLGTLQGNGPFHGAGTSGAILLTQQFVAVMASTTLILAAVASERRGREALERSESRYKAESAALAVLNETGAVIAAELDLERAVQVVIDAGAALTHARYAAFFYSAPDGQGHSMMLYALSGAPRSAFDAFGHPRATEVFAPTFEGTATIRSGDITQDPRYGRNDPHFGMPKGHLPVRSYLAVPVRSRSGEIIGGLFFGHSDPDVFDERAQWLAEGVASHAAIAIDNARLYQSAQAELAQRRRAEELQRLLINELNHRVKNTLATVQSLAAQTLRSSDDLATAREAFDRRLMALSATHNLLTQSSWASAELGDLVRQAAEPFVADRFIARGPSVSLSPARSLALSMALHELSTNALKYGALSVADGVVRLTWRVTAGQLELVWAEEGGPPVVAPTRRGFGTRLISQALARELRGQVRLEHDPAGVRCEIRFPLDAEDAPGPAREIPEV